MISKEVLRREFSSVFFVAVHIQQQSEVGTKTTLNELYSIISKQENAHPDAVFLVASDFNAGKLNPSTCEFQISLTVAPA
jgi:hypothetical protein